ncbi:MAG: MFS transporter [Thermomicrobiales bacterium]
MISRQGTAAPRQSSFTRTFRALGHRNYRLFWIGQLISQTGTWMRTTANSWLVLQLTGSALALGAITAMQFLPILLFSLFGGVLADRLPKRQTLLVTQSIMCLQAVIVAALTATGRIQMGHLYVLTGILGCALAIDNPTRQAFVSELVGPDDLPNAVALNSSVFNATRIIGPSVAGVLIAATGLAWPFALNAASYLAVLAMLLLMRPEQFFLGKRRARSGVFREIGEGFAYIVKTPDALLICLLMAILGLFGYNFTVVLPLIARDIIHTGPAGFGALTSAMGLGSLIAALGIAYYGKATRRTLMLGAAGFSVLLGMSVLSPVWLITAPLMVALGLCSIIFTATANTRLQLLAPPELRGRVLSIYMLLFGGTTPLGGLIIGSLAERQGIQRAQIEVAFICVLGVVLGVWYAYRQRMRLEPDAPPVREPAIVA